MGATGEIGNSLEEQQNIKRKMMLDVQKKTRQALPPASPDLVKARIAALSMANTDRRLLASSGRRSTFLTGGGYSPMGR